MDYKIKNIGLLAFFVLVSLLATTAKGSSQKNLEFRLSSKANNSDSTAQNIIVVDTSQIACFKKFLYEKEYNKLDSLLQEYNTIKEMPNLLAELESFKRDVEDGKYNNTQLWVWILLFSLAVFWVLFLVYVVIKLRGLRDVIIETVTDSERVKEWLEGRYEKKAPSVSQKSYDEDVEKLQNENCDLKDRVARLEDAIREWEKKSETIIGDLQTSSSQPIETQRKFYADSIIDGVFCRVRQQENDDSIFVLNLKNETSASFSLCEHAYSRVLVNASFLDGCEKQIIGNRSVEIMREGEAEKGGDGKWKVVIPLKVEIR